MKAILFFAMLGLLLSESLVARKSGIQVGGKSKVTEVTLFQDRAFVKRRQTVQLGKGVYSVEFSQVTPKAEIEGSGLAKMFRVHGTQTVRDGKSRTKLFIAKKQIPYQEHLELVASKYPYVFRKGEIINPFSWELAPGDLSLYYNGSYIQQMWMDAVPRNKRFGVNAGVDHDLRVSRWNEDKIEGPSLMDKTKHHLRGWKTKVENFGSNEKSIKVFEQIPISELKDVRVETTGSTKGFKTDENTPGWIYWNITLQSRKTETLLLALNVAVPSDFQFSW